MKIESDKTIWSLQQEKISYTYLNVHNSKIQIQKIGLPAFKVDCFKVYTRCRWLVDINPSYIQYVSNSIEVFDNQSSADS